MPITYTDKVSTVVNPLPDINKVTDDDMNEIKSVVNTHIADVANPHGTTAAQVGAYTSGDVDTLLAAKSNKAQTINTQINDYLILLADADALITGNKATPLIFTIQPDATVNHAIGTRIYFQRLGAGQLSIAQGAAVTVTGSAGVLTDPGLNIIFFAQKTAANSWTLQNGSSGEWVTYTPTWTGFSAAPTAGTVEYFLNGKMCTIHIQQVAGTSNSTATTVTLPFSAEGVNVFIPISVVGATQQAGRLQTAAGSNILTLYATPAAGAWTASGSKNCQISSFSYRIA